MELRRFGERVKDTLGILLSVPRQRKLPWLDSEKIEGIRDERVRRTVSFAAAHVPFYRRYFENQGLDPRDFRTVEDLTRLPRIDRKLVSRRSRDFLAGEASDRAESFRSSGSSGLPITVWHDRASLLANIAYGERERQVLTNLLGRQVFYRELGVFPLRGIRGRVGKLYKKGTFLQFGPRREVLDLTTPTGRVWKKILDIQPHVLRGYGSYLEVLFRIALEKEMCFPSLRVVVYGGDCMTESGRKLIEDEFGIPVLSTYQAAEAFKIGFFCEERNGFHLHEDLVHVTILRRDGSLAEPGETGQVQISNLVNRGTVLLNYSLGDEAAWLEDRCPCGRSLRRLSNIRGRTEDVIFLDNGEFLHPRSLWHIMRSFEEVLQYQLIQEDHKDFLLRLVPVGETLPEEYRQAICNVLHGHLGSKSRLRVSLEDQVIRESSGKFRSVVVRCESSRLNSRASYGS